MPYVKNWTFTFIKESSSRVFHKYVISEFLVNEQTAVGIEVVAIGVPKWDEMAYESYCTGLAKNLKYICFFMAFGEKFVQP